MPKPLILKDVAASGSLDIFRMEYDVFKTFVSWHPFDWLYPFIKARYTLISQNNPWNVKILGFVRNVQRARKKWYFIKIEDISDSLEFFVKDTLGIAVFDIILIEWFMAKSLRIKKISKISLDKLISLAQSAQLYDIEQTVARIKKNRSKNIDESSDDSHTYWTEIITENSLESVDNEMLDDDIVTTFIDVKKIDVDVNGADVNGASIHDSDIQKTNIRTAVSKDQTIISNQIHTWENNNPQDVDMITTTIQQREFVLPTSISSIRKYMDIIKSYPWDQAIKLWKNIHHVSPQGIAELTQLAIVA